MASAKKTNFISYELKALEEYFKQLNRFLKKNPPDLAEDRVEHMTSPKGMPMIKVIASREVQIKLFTETLEKLPKILTDLNLLRKAVDGQEVVSVRGDMDVPGFMDEDDEDDEDDKDDEYVKQQPANSKVKFDDDDEFEAKKDVVEKKALPPIHTDKGEVIYDFSNTDSVEDDEDDNVWDADLEDE